jgi:ABC-2 type transport system permease protein
MTKHYFGDTAVLLGRSLRHIMRSPDTIITTTIMPIAFMLLFVYVFGGAINSGTDSYVSYQLPGILLITIASGISYTAYRLFLDMKNGIFERLAVHADRTVVRAVGSRGDVAGRHSDLARARRARRPHGLPLGAGVLAWLEVAGILILFTLALTSIAVIHGLREIRGWRERVRVSAYPSAVH